MDGAQILSAEQKAKYAGCRLENAKAFQSVATGITSAEVLGDFPQVVDALNAAGVRIEGESKKRAKSKAAD